MGFAKNLPVWAVIILSSTAIAATTQPPAAAAPKAAPVATLLPASINIPVPLNAPAKTIAVAKPAPAKKEVYSDTSIAQAKAAQTTTAQTTTAVDVNTNIPYESMLPKDAEIVAGDPTKNEFFIVAAEDAAQIKKMLAQTKPGTDVASNDVKSKQKILKVKLDETNSTLVSMDVVSSINEVAKSATNPSVRMTNNDEVLTIFTKNRITPVGSRAVAAAVPKTQTLPAEEEKPMIKLLAANNSEASTVTKAAPASLKTAAAKKPEEFQNPLTTIKPVVSTMPNVVAEKHVIEQPIEKPVELPQASRDKAPTLEMVLQQAKQSPGTVSEDATVIKTKLAAVTPAPQSNTKPMVKEVTQQPKVKMMAKAIEIKKVGNDKKKSVAIKVEKKSVAIKASQPKIKVAHAPTPKKKTVAAGNAKKQVASWKAKHAIPTKKVVATRTNNKKKTLQVGVVKSYADYLSETGQKTRRSAE